MPASQAADLPPSAWAEPPSQPTSTLRGPTRSPQFVQSTATCRLTEIIKFLMSQLDYPSTTKFEDDLFIILKSLNFPYEINKSTLRSPNSPHIWPSYLALIHWMVQIASYTNHLLSNSRPFVENNSMHMYALDSYLNYIRGDDDAVEDLDREFIGKLE
ncbi:hypothetical protein Dsin_013391 [Dipteronia sinensis]|uniref:Kinetochore protein NDC80 n=1 Tax=Dipteronia sinensis TaxID=43782 RepID=A0AAE0AK14_9ROSI|nr:hypothetical protein Dsin_013391 [Dipteronia sinensis]